MIDDIIQRIHDEDQREIQEKMCRMKKTREEMMAFEAAQDEWKQRKKKEIIEENRRIQEFLLKKGADVSARLEEKKRREEARGHIQEILAKQMRAETARRREHEEIVQELLLEEQKEAQAQRHKKDLEKQIRLKLDTRKCLSEQLKEKEARIRQEAAEDSKYKEQLLAKLAEDQKLEQMSEQKRRMKMLQLRRDVEEMIADKRQKRAEEMQKTIFLKQKEDVEMEEKKKIVEEERILLLQQHVRNLIGYLPKGLLKPSDLPHLNNGVVL